MPILASRDYSRDECEKTVVGQEGWDGMKGQVKNFSVENFTKCHIFRSVADNLIKTVQRIAQNEDSFCPGFYIV